MNAWLSSNPLNRFSTLRASPFDGFSKEGLREWLSERGIDRLLFADAKATAQIATG
jgi:hypothetical protein